MTDTAFQSVPRNASGSPRCTTAPRKDLFDRPRTAAGAGVRNGWWRSLFDCERLSPLRRMIMNGGELEGSRVLARDTVAAMSTNAMGISDADR